MSSSSSSISTSAIVLTTAAVLATGAVGYAVYFDYRRRNDADFRKHLKKQQKRVAKSQAESQKAAEQGQHQRIRAAVDDANDEGFPRNPDEMEAYFMQEVAAGEKACSDGTDPVDAALCFYRALKVYPQPRELIGIYDKTVPKPILDILAEMIAVDPSISVTGSAGGSDAGSATVE